MNPDERLDCSDMPNTKCPKCNSEDIEIVSQFGCDEFNDYVTEYLVCSDCCYIECLGSSLK